MLFRSLEKRVKGGKIAKYEVVAARALEALEEYCVRLGTKKEQSNEDNN